MSKQGSEPSKDPAPKALKTDDHATGRRIGDPFEGAQRTSRIRIKNRRKMFLDRHPSYFDSPDLELADPLLYDRCVRRFQSTAEREAQGRERGYSGVLEADLYRSEAKLEALHSYNNQSSPMTSSPVHHVTYMRGPDGEVLPEDPDEIPKDKEEGLSRWKYQMTMRFLNGEDNDFPYQDIDENDEWDIIENREAEDRWFEDEEPQWVGKDDRREGETGIQDF